MEDNASLLINYTGNIVINKKLLLCFLFIVVLKEKRFFAFLKYYRNDLEQLYSYHAEFFRVKTEKVMQIAESDDRKSREKTQNGRTVIMQNFFMSRLGSEVKYSK